MDTSPISFEHKMFPKVSQSTSPSLSAEEEGFGVERHVSFKRVGSTMQPTVTYKASSLSARSARSRGVGNKDVWP